MQFVIERNASCWFNCCLTVCPVHWDSIWSFKHPHLKGLEILRKRMCYLKCDRIGLISFWFSGPQTQVFLGFPVSISKCWDGSQDSQVATTCFSCSPPDLNLLDLYFIFVYMHNNHCHRVTAHLQLNILLLYYFCSFRQLHVSANKKSIIGLST